jgi:hypothetical protein
MNSQKNNSKLISSYPIDSTSGSSASIYYYSSSRITEQARAILPKVINQQMSQVIKNLIIIIEEVTSKFAATGYDINLLPPLIASISEDKSVSLNWISPDYRIGFNIEPNVNDSSWFLITTKHLNENGAYGSLSQLNDRDIVNMLMGVVQANS